MNIIPTAKKTTFNVTSGVMGCLILPQNGVVDGDVHFGSGGSSAQLDRASALDSRNGNVSAGGTPKQRPSALEVGSKNGFVAKNLCADGDDIEDGSLPCTPELQADRGADVSGCSAADEVLDSDTRQLICRFFSDYAGLSKARWVESKALSTMKRVVEDVLEKHRYAYNGMINKLSLDDRGDDMRFLGAVAKSLFADGTTNWGRIASLVAFGAVVCQYMKEKGRGSCVELVGQEISSYLLSEQREWLVKNNAWDGFVEFFRVADPESTVRNTLMAFAGFAGIGATLALLIR